MGIHVCSRCPVQRAFTRDCYCTVALRRTARASIRALRAQLIRGSGEVLRRLRFEALKKQWTDRGFALEATIHHPPL